MSSRRGFFPVDVVARRLLSLPLVEKIGVENWSEGLCCTRSYVYFNFYKNICTAREPMGYTSYIANTFYLTPSQVETRFGGQITWN